MMKFSGVLKSVIVILTFLVAYYGRGIAGNVFNIAFDSVLARTIYFYGWWIVPTLLSAGFWFGFRNLPEVLGLHKNVVKGLAFAVVTVSPMLISSAVIGNFNTELDFMLLMRGTLFAGFFEEYLFRGFLFGILFRKLGWGFIPAGMIGALFFGVGHIYQGTNFAETAGIFLITSVGALWFAWLFVEWDNNLWVPIFLHIFMNLSWALFDISSNALGDIYANIFRAVTIALTIVLTIRHKKQQGLSIGKRNLFLNQNNA